MPAREWLAAYAREFDCVEINSSFYRLPEATSFDAWRASVPSTFVFAVKASRYLTHFLRLTRPTEPIARLFARVRHLDGRLGPIVYQLPPRWVPDAERLVQFIDALPRSTARVRRSMPLTHVVEFRDSRGYEPGVLQLLERRGVSLCVHDMEGSESPLTAIGPVGYLRCHGYGRRYGGSYPRRVPAPMGGLADDHRTRSSGVRLLQQRHRRACGSQCAHVARARGGVSHPAHASASRSVFVNRRRCGPIATGTRWLGTQNALPTKPPRGRLPWVRT